MKALCWATHYSFIFQFLKELRRILRKGGNKNDQKKDTRKKYILGLILFSSTLISSKNCSQTITSLDMQQSYDCTFRKKFKLFFKLKKQTKSSGSFFLNSQKENQAN